MSADRLRVGVVGGGLIAQAVHLPNLAAAPDDFEVVALADPSRRVVDGVTARYGIPHGHLDWRTMLERETLDALVICSPHATHAAVIHAALDRELHVLVEKPLCITVEDAEAIAAHAADAGLVVQVGYMKRYTAAYHGFITGLRDAGALRLVDVVTYDPWMAREPFVPWSDMVRADDIPSAVIAAAAQDEARQVEAAVGQGDPATVRAYSYTFLACLVHDVNLVHGAFDALGLEEDGTPLASAVWADGDAASGTLQLPGGALWHCSWALLRKTMHFEERVSLLFDDGVHELRFPMPYDTVVPVEHRIVDAPGGEHRDRIRRMATDGYVAELQAFLDSIREGAVNRTPPEQSVRDLRVLQALFAERRDTPSPT